MSLFEHARATRILADALATETSRCRRPESGDVLACLSIAYNRAADDMEAAARADLAAAYPQKG
jgi:hypothetical protein